MVTGMAADEADPVDAGTLGRLRDGEGSVASLDLQGARVLLTGGVGDIGLVAARRFLDAGAAVVVSDVVPQAAAAARLKRANCYGVEYLICDVTSADAVEKLFMEAKKLAGTEFNVVCAHAGIVDSHPIEQFPIESFDSIMAINVRGSFLVATAAARRWRDASLGGNLIFTSSWVQDVPWPEIAPYSASKAAIRSLMRSFARELAPYGIRSNAVAPGIVGVGMARRQWDTDTTYRARAERAIPLGQLQTPESVADAMLFLASRLSAYMTGATLLVDGGASLYPMD